MIRRLLVSVSHSPAVSAQGALAIDIARRHDARVTGFVAVDTESIGNVGPAPIGAMHYRMKLVETRRKRAMAAAEQALTELEGRCASAGVDYLGYPTQGAPDRTLSDAWRFHDLGLIPTRPWAPSEDEPGDVSAVLHLVALGLRPMLAVPEGASAEVGKALVALSGSLDSAKAFKQFLQLAVWPDIPLHIVTAGNPKSGEPPEALLEAAASYARAHGREVTTRALPKSGDRTQALLDEAKGEGAGVFVIGSSFRRLLSFERFGSHATGLLERSPVPVFVSH